MPFLDWSPVTREEALDGTKDSFYIYVAEKTLAERALWDFADKHPHIDVTTGELGSFGTLPV